jgi:predicted ATP-dependent endonuclease of OLD family
MIRDLTIDNYRLFHHFNLESIAGVNLIVGTNNSGKSSLLEAIHLLTSDDMRLSLIFILSERGEFVSGTLDPRVDRSRTGGYQVSQIFHNRLLKLDRSASIHSSLDKEVTLRIALQKARLHIREGVDQLPLFDTEEMAEVTMEGGVELLVFERDGYESEATKERLRITEDGLLLPDRPYNIRRIIHPRGKSRLITANYLGYDELAILWDKITLTPKEDKVVEALKILEPKVERISFTSTQTSNSGILLRLKGENEPIPLGSMGDGMRRILAIIASLVSVEQGTLLVDEIDTGLYHGVLTDMWRLVLETSYKQDAQVFATTHSWDCVKAFQQALNSFTYPDIGRLIRLEKADDQIRAVTYLRNELDIAIEQGIEVR